MHQAAINSAGRNSATEASMIRWRIPPENWCG